MLDLLVKAKRTELGLDEGKDLQGTAVSFPEPEPWPDPGRRRRVDHSRICRALGRAFVLVLSEIADAIRRYVVMFRFENRRSPITRSCCGVAVQKGGAGEEKGMSLDDAAAGTLAGRYVSLAFHPDDRVKKPRAGRRRPAKSIGSYGLTRPDRGRAPARAEHRRQRAEPRIEA